jgi:hypothetical protein
MEVSVDEDAPYVQQQVILTVRIFHRIQWREGSLSDPRFQGGEVLVERLGDDRTYQAVRDGQSWQVIERRYALFPQAHGKLEMEPLLLSISVPAGKRTARRRSPFGDPFFDDFFSRQDYVRKLVRSKPLALQVKPVPPAFSGRHWLPARRLELKESWSSPLDALKAGEPVTRTLTLVVDGVTKGQLPELTLPEVPGLRVYPGEMEVREVQGPLGVRSLASRKFALIPEKAGEYRLPPVTLKWWDLAQDREAVARLSEHRLRVAPGTGAVTGTPAAPPQRSSLPAKPAPAAPPAPEAAAPGVSQAIPFLQDPRVRMLLGGMVVLLLLWLVTLAAWLRARKADGEGDGSGREPPEKVPAERLRQAWRELHRAAAAGEAGRLRQALLQLAALLWPESPPRSLEALARRAAPPLSEHLLRLSRHLYGNGTAAWDGALIEREMKQLASTGSRKEKSADGEDGLRPLYPA